MLQFPSEVLTGTAGAFAKTWSQYLEAPESFLFMSYITLLGHLISDKVTLDSETKPQPRLYTVLLGESGITRKSTAIQKTIYLFEYADQIKQTNLLNLIRGVGSAEGLANSFNANLPQTNRAILILDELKTLVGKCQIPASVLLPCINTLFESNQYYSATRKQSIKINDAHLSVLSASTLDTYQNMFKPQFLDIGFINRLFIIIGEGERKFSIPKVIPIDDIDEIIYCHLDLLDYVNKLSLKSSDRCFKYTIDKDAFNIFNEWYINQDYSDMNKRLDTYGHRLLILLAVNDYQNKITADIAKKVVKLLEYQLEVRRQTDPIVAYNKLAELELKIINLLKQKGVLSNREIERKLHKERYGHLLWQMALRNLIHAGEIRQDDLSFSFIEESGVY